MSYAVLLLPAKGLPSCHRARAVLREETELVRALRAAKAILKLFGELFDVALPAQGGELGSTVRNDRVLKQSAVFDFPSGDLYGTK